MSKMKELIKKGPLLSCQQCGVQMERQRFSSGRLEDFTRFTKRKFCSKKCRDNSLIKDHVGKNQFRWRARKQKLDACELCGSAKNLQVHHKNKTLSDNTLINLQTLCASCHNTLHWKDRRANGN